MPPSSCGKARPGRVGKTLLDGNVMKKTFDHGQPRVNYEIYCYIEIHDYIGGYARRMS